MLSPQPSKQLLRDNENTFQAACVTTTLLLYLWFGKAPGCLYFPAESWLFDVTVDDSVSGGNITMIHIDQYCCFSLLSVLRKEM